MESTRRTLLEVLVKADHDLSLGQAAEAVGLSPSATHRQLALLVQEGIVQREGRQKEARYRLASCLRAVWTLREDGVRFAEEWTHHGPVDWRFPLVSRVPDAAARESLLRFLEACGERGLFTPWLLRGHAKDSRGVTVDVHAYGSAVRGEAHAGSDVDVLLLHDAAPGTFPYETAVRDVSDALNLEVPRRLDVRTYPRRAFFDGTVDLYERVRKTILATAITIHSTAPRPQFIESGRARLGTGAEL